MTRLSRIGQNCPFDTGLLRFLLILTGGNTVGLLKRAVEVALVIEAVGS